MELLPLLFPSFCFLTLSGLTFGAESGSPDSRVIVMEDDDVILPCSLSTNENIEKKLFVWKKEGTVPLKEVFMFDASTYSKGQDDEFKGRVSHFPEQLKYGNASIRMSKTKLEDRGIYTCSFPVMQPSVKTSRIELVVGAAPDLSVTNLKETNDWVLLKCDVKGAYPEPTVEWWNSNNETIPSEEPQVSKKGERFYVTLKTTVKKTDYYRCVATQKDIHHQIYTEIYVHLNEPVLKIPNFTGAAPKPYVTILKEKGLLQCEVPGASPKPTVEWRDSDNKTLLSKTVQDEEQQGRFHVTVQTTVTEPGCYHCVATQMEKWHRISSEICVHHEPVLKIPIFTGAAPKPYVTILKEKGLLQCEVPGASPKPTVEWRDSDNKTLLSKTVQDEEQQARFHVTVQTTVTEPGCYHCVATQMEKWHRISSEICVHHGLPEWAAALIRVLVVFIIALVIALAVTAYCLKKDSQRTEIGPSSELQRNLTSEQP